MIRKLMATLLTCAVLWLLAPLVIERLHTSPRPHVQTQALGSHVASARAMFP
jgi:hypothetical protein